MPSLPAIAAFFCVLLPWLNPFSPGPTSAVGPYLFAGLCAGLLLLALAAHPRQGRDTELLRAVVAGWLVAALLSALIGLLQYFQATGPFGVWLNHTELGEAFGNLRQRNQFASLIHIGLAALIGLYLIDEADANAGVRWRLGWPGAAAAAVLLGVANAASSSRTGLMQLLLLVLLALWWRHGGPAGRARQALWLVLLALAAFALASLALPLAAGLDPLNSGAWARLRAGDPACASRLTLWGNVLHLIAQRPWLGWGWGELDYAHFITLYPGARFCDILDNAHNLPLHLAVELGLPVAVLACLALVIGLWRARPWRERQPARQMAWAILAVIGLHSLLEYPLWYGPFQIATLLALWLLCWLPKAPESFQPPRGLGSFGLVAQYSQALAAILIIALVGLSAWDYQRASQIYLAPEERSAAYQTDTLAKTRSVWLFQDQVRFAELTLSDVTLENAHSMREQALEMLHFSPEVRVVERILDAALLLHQDNALAYFAARYQAAFPDDYARWAGRNKAHAVH